MRPTAVYYWLGSSFTLLEYLSVLSTACNTSCQKIEVYFDERDPPTGRHWRALADIAGVEKLPASGLVGEYLRLHAPSLSIDQLDARTVSDVFRYCRLFDKGGIWFDFDTFQVRDVFALGSTLDLLAGWEDETWAAIGVLGFRHGHPLLASLLAELPERIRSEGIEDRGVVGPRWFTQVIRRMGYASVVLPRRYFYPVHYSHRARVVMSRYELHADTHSIHVWGSYNRPLFAGKNLEDFAGFDSTFFDMARSLLKPSGACPS